MKKFLKNYWFILCMLIGIVADVLGEHACGYFLDNKHQDWEEYNQQVTPYELKKYLPKL